MTTGSGTTAGTTSGGGRRLLNIDRITERRLAECHKNKGVAMCDATNGKCKWVQTTLTCTPMKTAADSATEKENQVDSTSSDFCSGLVEDDCGADKKNERNHQCGHFYEHDQGKCVNILQHCKPLESAYCAESGLCEWRGTPELKCVPDSSSSDSSNNQNSQSQSVTGDPGGQTNSQSVTGGGAGGLESSSSSAAASTASAGASVSLIAVSETSKLCNKSGSALSFSTYGEYSFAVKNYKDPIQKDPRPRSQHGGTVNDNEYRTTSSSERPARRVGRSNNVLAGILVTLVNRKVEECPSIIQTLIGNLSKEVVSVRSDMYDKCTSPTGEASLQSFGVDPVFRKDSKLR